MKKKFRERINKEFKSIVKSFMSGVPLIFTGAYLLGVFTIVECVITLGWLWVFPSLVLIGGMSMNVCYEQKLKDGNTT